MPPSAPVGSPVGHVRMVLAVSLLACGCIESTATVCSDGRICAAGQVCDETNHVCSDPTDQCLDFRNDEPCASGFCQGGRCVESCGNDQLDPTVEDCDPTDFDPSAGDTCVSLQFDAGRQRCASDCSGLSSAPCMRFGWTVEGPFVNVTDILEDISAIGSNVLILLSPGGVRASAQGWIPVGIGGDDIAGRALWGSSSRDIWVVGADGDRLHHWDGSNWTEVPSPVGGLREIWGSSADDVFAIGDGGAAIHFDGKAWERQPTPTPAGDLLAIAGLGPNEVYAAGRGGVLLRYTEGVWVKLDSGTDQTLAGVWADPRGDLWTVTGTSARRFDGSEWSEAIRFEGDPDGRGWIAGNGPSDVWVSAGSEGIVRHYNGTAWSTLLVHGSAAQPLWVDRNMTVVGANYGDGEGRLRRWFGAGNVLSTLPSSGIWRDVWADETGFWIAVGSDPTEVRGLAADSEGQLDSFDQPIFHVAGFDRGRLYAASVDGTIHERKKGGWTVSRAAAGDLQLFDLWTSGESDVYAALGSLEPAAAHVLHFDGARWSELPSIDLPCFTSISGGWASGPDDIFVSGFDLLARFDGSKWTRYAEEVCGSIYGPVWGSARDDVWVSVTSGDVGGGTIMQHWTGSEWTGQLIEVGQDTSAGHGLTGTAWDDIFLGNQAHFDGQVWSPLRSSAMVGSPIFAQPSRLFMVEFGFITSLFVRTRFWNPRAFEVGCDDGVDDDADGATDRYDRDCGGSNRR